MHRSVLPVNGVVRQMLPPPVRVAPQRTPTPAAADFTAAQLAQLHAQIGHHAQLLIQVGQ